MTDQLTGVQGGADSPAPGGSGRQIVILCCICMLGLCVRLLFLADWAGNPLFLNPVGDELNFHQTALGLLGLGGEPDSFLYQPLYSFYLAAIYSLVGVDVALVRTVQLCIGLLSILLFYGLGRELNGVATGLIAAACAALFGPFVFFEGQLLAPALAAPLVIGGLWCLLRSALRARAWLLAPAGVLVGLAMMGRPNLLIVMPLAGLWWLWRTRTWRQRLLGAGLGLLGLALGLSPAWVHNLRQGQAWVPVSASGGHSFYLGNNPQATGRFHVPRGERIDDSSHQAYRQSWIALAEEAAGHPLSLSEVSSYWYGRGFDFWREHPGDALILLGKKALLALNAEETPIHHPYYVVAAEIPLLGYLLSFGVLFPLALLGGVLGCRRIRGVGLLLATFWAYLAGLCIFYVADRYRVMLMPMVIPLAALGVVELTRRVRTVGALRSSWALLILAAGFALTQLSFIDAAARQRSFYGFYNLMGKVEGDRGHLAAAEAHFTKALSFVDPGRGALVRANLGLLAEKRGRPDLAFEHYRLAAELSPENRFARRKLAALAERRGDLPGAIRWWQEVAALSADPSRAQAEIDRLRAALPPPPDAGPAGAPASPESPGD